MADFNRRHLLASLTSIIGIAAAASAAPALAQLQSVQKKPQPVILGSTKPPSAREEAELRYRLERSMRTADYTARATLRMASSVEMADTMGLWETRAINVPAGTTPLTTLGHGLVDALGWLLHVSQPFAESDGAADGLSRAELAGLAAELPQIWAVLDACSAQFNVMQLQGEALDIASNTQGLANIARNCTTLAQRLAAGASDKPVKEPK